MTSTSARTGQGSAQNIHKVLITGTTAVNSQAHKTRCEQCSWLFCFKPRGIQRPTLIEFLSSKAVCSVLTENERWRAIGMLQNGSIQVNVARQFNVSQSVISRLRNRNQQTETVTDLPPSWASTFHYPTPEPPACHKYSERPNPERNSTTAATFPCRRNSKTALMESLAVDWAQNTN